MNTKPQDQQSLEEMGRMAPSLIAVMGRFAYGIRNMPESEKRKYFSALDLEFYDKFECQFDDILEAMEKRQQSPEIPGFEGTREQLASL